MRTTYVLHASSEGYAVRAVAENMIVWGAPDASPAGTAGLVTFLNAHAGDLPPALVRRMLDPFGNVTADAGLPLAERPERAS